MARHNKKRNVGLVYEMLIRRLSQAVVEQDRRKISTIKNILESRFKPGTELHKEFRLFNAITVTSGVSDHIAYRILDEAKRASADHDAKKLDIEKSRLIKDINHKLNETNFYNTKIDNYPVYASAQQLFNSWRSKSTDITEIVKHEEKIHAWLVREAVDNSVEKHKTKDVNDITVKIMQEKFEKKYGSALNSEQSVLLKLFCEGNNEDLVAYMQNIDTQLSQQIKKAKTTMSGDKFLFEKVTRVVAATKNEKQCNVNEVSKSMALAQLLSELREFENGKR